MPIIKKSNYWRADIQGLRAIAVLSVIFYHLGLPVKSGFLGVDVFIVVSGFVITGLLMREIDEIGKIRLVRFFRWRFMRLFPAHVVMLATTLLIFYFVGPYGAHKAALNQARASVAFLANVYFFARSKDYFALGDDLTLFLNTWSLALEEQFYAMFAVIVSVLILFSTLFFRRRTKKWREIILVAVVLMAISSVIFALISSQTWSSNDERFRTSTINPSQWVNFVKSRGTEFAFYSPFTRAWQFLLGSLVSIVGKRQTKYFASVLSKTSLVFLIGILIFSEVDSFVFFTSSRILVSFLTVVILINGLNWLSVQWLVSLGDRSYSLYLYHYPLIVISRSLNSSSSIFLVVAATLIFAELSFRFVETPLRQGDKKSQPQLRSLQKVATFLALLSFVSICIRLDSVAKKFIDPSYFVNSPGNENFREIGDKANCLLVEKVETCDQNLSGSILLIGDSHAGSLQPGFFKAVSDLGLTPQRRLSGKCLFVNFDVSLSQSDKKECGKLGLELQREIIEQRPRLVVFLACGRLYDSCPEGLESEDLDVWLNAGVLALNPIIDAGIPVAVVHDLPILSPDPRYAISVFRSVFNLPIIRHGFDNNYRRLQKYHSDSLLSRLKSQSGVVFEVDFLKKICDEVSCQAKNSKGENLWNDEDHLSVAGSFEISNSIASEISRILKIN